MKPKKSKHRHIVAATDEDQDQKTLVVREIFKDGTSKIIHVAHEKKKKGHALIPNNIYGHHQ